MVVWRVVNAYGVITSAELSIVRASFLLTQDIHSGEGASFFDFVDYSSQSMEEDYSQVGLTRTLT